MEEKKVESENLDWTSDYNQPAPTEEGKERLPKFNLILAKDDLFKTEDIVFQDDGKQINNAYGKSVLFNVAVKDIPMVWFVRGKMYSLLNAIAAQKKLKGSLVGLKAQVTRTGRTQQDTRWKITFK